LISIVRAVSFSALLLAVAVYWHQDAPKLIPRSMVFNYWWLSLLLIGGLRLLMRQYFMGDWYSSEQPYRLQGRDAGLPRVAVYGAGAAGNQLVAALRLGRGMRPVAFIDDDSNIATRVIAGLRVYTPRHIQQMIDETGADEILLAMPSASRGRRREILESLESYRCMCAVFPALWIWPAVGSRSMMCRRWISPTCSGVMRCRRSRRCLSVVYVARW
jgi:FlaA1/EpsC-like NDP-sugar epimerase